MDYVLGLDNGGTVIKAAIYDKFGNEIAVSSYNTEMISPYPGFNERDMEVMWGANCYCIKEVITKAGIPSEKIINVTLTGHGKGLYLWGNKGVIRNGVLSSDTRSNEYITQWENTLKFEKTKSKLKQNILPGHPISILAWIKDNEPETYSKIKWIFSAKDYIRFRLTGEAYSEITDISGSGFMDITTRKIDKEILNEFGLGELYEKIPPVKKSTDICGFISKEVSEITGLQEKTPVSGGLFDIDACALAMNLVQEDILCSINGTWSINEFISNKPISDSNVMNSIYALEPYYLVEDSSATGAGNLDWILNNFFNLDNNESNYDKVNGIISRMSPNSSNILFYPYLYGTNSKYPLNGNFIGITNGDSINEILFSVYEGIIFSTKIHVDRMLELNPNIKKIRLAGGVTKSNVWVQMFADILNIPIETISHVKEIGALGAAIVGFISSGIYKSYEEASEYMVHINSEVVPNLNRSIIYSDKYKRYIEVMKKLEEIHYE